MDMDGGNPVRLAFADNAPADDELDADPCWGPDGKIVFKREQITDAPRFSRLYTATIDTATMTLENVTQRTDGTPGTLNFYPPGDYDPKISPDGNLIASYRHLADAPGLIGDWDIWVGLYGDPSSVSFLDVDPAVADLFPRWNQAGDKLAIWSLDSAAVPDPLDIFVIELAIFQSPFSVSVAYRINITAGDGWIESMPAWNTDPGDPDRLVFSAVR